MTSVELFLGIGETMSIVHHIPGRIRLRFSSQSLPLLKQFGDIEALQNLDVKDILSAIDGIKNVKINEMVGSATIEYDKNEWDTKLWQSLCGGENHPELKQKISTTLQDLGVDPIKQIS